jgi:hypothetical protein
MLKAREWEHLKDNPIQLIHEFMRYLDIHHDDLLRTKTRYDFIHTLRSHVINPTKHRTPIWRRGGLYDTGNQQTSQFKYVTNLSK